MSMRLLLDHCEEAKMDWRTNRIEDSRRKPFPTQPVARAPLALMPSQGDESRKKKGIEFRSLNLFQLGNG